MTRTSEIALEAQRIDQSFSVFIGTDDDRATIEPALPRPATHQQEQATPEGDERDEPEDVECAEPGAGELIAGFGEERNAHGDQKDHGPRRGEPHVLLLVPAEGLNLIDIGGLKCQHGAKRDAENGGGVMPGKTPRRHHVCDIDGKADGNDEGEFDEPYRTGKHDRRIGAHRSLRCDLERRRR